MASPFTSLGFVFPRLTNKTVGQRALDSPPRLQMPREGVRALSHRFLCRICPSARVLAGQSCLPFPSFSQIHQEQGGNLGKSQQTGQGPGTWHLLPRPVLSLLALPNMLSPGPEAGDSQGRARGLALCFSIHRGSDCRNKAAGAPSLAKDNRQQVEGWVGVGGRQEKAPIFLD